MDIELKPKAMPQETTPKHKVVNLPEGHILEYLAKDQEGKIYVVHRPEKGWDYNQFHLHIGPEGHVAEVDVKKVRRYRDGGTTYIDFVVDTQQGQLYFPTQFNEDLKPTVTLNGETSELEKLL